MPVTIQGKVVNGVVIGNTTFTKNAGWVPLKLPSNVTDGQVLFNDNGDGTACIVGSLSVDISKESSSPSLLLMPPSGYQFTSVNWNNGGLSTNSLTGTLSFGKLSGEKNLLMFVTVVNGSLYGYNPNTSDGHTTLVFSESASINGSSSADPAVINIEKI